MRLRETSKIGHFVNKTLEHAMSPETSVCELVQWNNLESVSQTATETTNKKRWSGGQLENIHYLAWQYTVTQLKMNFTSCSMPLKRCPKHFQASLNSFDDNSECNKEELKWLSAGTEMKRLAIEYNLS